jgi:hypothetical protein
MTEHQHYWKGHKRALNMKMETPPYEDIYNDKDT